jgi:hypothetical protein
MVNIDNYVDKDRSAQKAKGFLKNINKGKQIPLKGTLKQMEGVSLMIFSIDSGFRRVLYRVQSSRFFEWFVLFVIVVSTVQLAVENPLNDPDG